jgi:hypothetical protein
MDPEFLTMMPNKIGIENYISRDAWGNRTYGAKILFQGRVENRRRKVINRDGDEVISETTLYLDTISGISLDARITLPSGHYPAHPEIISLKLEEDEVGPYSTTLYV